MAALSVCTFTRDPIPAVAHSLEQFRVVADEIVAIVDDATAPADLDPLRRVCDRVILAPFHWPLEANLAWMEAQCTGDWVLRIDGDEVPSAALVDRLAEGSWADGVTHVAIARRWLWRDGATVLDQAPWWLDPQRRLIRRDMADWPDPSRGAHGVPRVSGASRLLVEPLYHLDLLVTDTAERLDRARRYEASAPGLVTAEGVNQNVAFYLPEARREVLATRPVPDRDAPVLRRVLDAFEADPNVSTPTEQDPTVQGHVRLGRSDDTRVAVQRIGREDPRPAPGDAHLEIFSAPRGPLAEGSTLTVAVRVTNRSAAAFTRSQDAPVSLGARILDEQGRVVAPETRGALPGRMEPGTSDTVVIHAGPLPSAGRYVLQIGALREGVTWFVPTLRRDIEVVRPRRVVISSGISRAPHLGDDLILTTVLAALALYAVDTQVVLIADDAAAATRRFGVPAVAGASALLGPARSRRELVRELWCLRSDARRLAEGGRPRRAANTELLEHLAAADVLAVLGAGWLAGAHRRSGIAPNLAEVEAARVLGLPVLFEAGSVGPFDGLLDRLAARRLLGAVTSVTVRDHRSAAQTHRLGIARRRIRVVPDVATAYPTVATDSMRDRWLEDLGMDPTRSWAVLSLRSGGGVDLAVVARTVDELARAGIATVFLSQHSDVTDDDASVGRDLATRCALVVPRDVPGRPVAVAVIRGATVVFGDRLHLAIVAAGAGVPGVFVATNPYDRRRSAALVGSSVTTVGTDAFAPSVLDAAGRTRGTPARVWDPEDFVARVDDLAG